jgi:hypothetical protein
MVHSAAILPFEDSGDAPALLAELAADGFERVPVFANAPDFELFCPHRALLGQRCDVPQGHGSIACNVLVATPVYLDHQENLGWDLVNYQLWQRRTSVRKAGTWLPVWLPGRATPRSTYALSWSGWPDSNRRPPAPKAGALTKLRHIPQDRSVAYRPALCPPRPAPPAGRRPRRCLARHGADQAAVRPDGPVTGTLTVLTGGGTGFASGARGRSSMAEPQPSKLVMRVRFPSPAPPTNPRSGGMPASPHPDIKTPCPSSVPVASDRLLLVPFRLDDANASPMAAAIASSRSLVACW